MIGQTLNNRYTVTARIGKGAMGTVYRATDSQTNQVVAIKVISRELALNPEMMERFRREGEALQQLRHPNIVGFIEAFQHEEQYVIVMEYVGGGSLHSLIKQGPLPINRTQKIALELCDALTRAHHLNIVHRDIKPENILLAEDGTPKLTDFGVAKLMSEATRLTGTGTQVGTPYYMCPEAWEGRPLDAQADIWSLGIVFYEMLAGEVPFGGETLVAVMNKVLNSPLPDLKTKRADIPEGLSQIIKRMLTRDKTKRYATIRQIAADLEVGAPSMIAPTPRTLPRLPKWAWGAMIGLVAIGGIILSIWGLGFLPSVTAPTAAIISTRTIDQSRTATPLPTVAARFTTSPGALREKIDLCGKSQDDLCFTDSQGEVKVMKFEFEKKFIHFMGASWSPDGKRIAFSACLEGDDPEPLGGGCSDLYVADRDGKNVKRIEPRDMGSFTQTTVWSPDGQWIAYSKGSSITIIRPDGTDAKTILDPKGGFGCLMAVVWAPDSQRLAIQAPCGSNNVRHIAVMNLDGSQYHAIYQTDKPSVSAAWIPVFTWSPDGNYVAITTSDTRESFLIDSYCWQKTTGCDAASRTKIDSIPTDWFPNVYPQWTTKTSTGSGQVVTTLIELSPTVGCNPKSAPTGIIVFEFGAGGSSTDKDQAQANVGKDTYASITVDGKPTEPLAVSRDGIKLNQFGRTIEMQWHETQWGAETWTQIKLTTPGQYKVESVWARTDGNSERRSCTLTITN